MNARNGLLIDTNVILDHYFLERDGHRSSFELISRALQQDIPLFVSVHSLKDFYYIAKQHLKQLVVTERPLGEGDALAIDEIVSKQLDNLLEIATVVGEDYGDVWAARRIQRIHSDFEDCLILAAGERSGADLLITNDERLIKHAPMVALTPADALVLIGN